MASKIPHLKTFAAKVYSLLRTVPKSKVVTYGQLAKMAGEPKAARAVGALMRTNPDMAHIPCHRVVGANGQLVGYSGHGGKAAKKKLLLAEGVKFKGERVDLEVSLLK